MSPRVARTVGALVFAAFLGGCTQSGGDGPGEPPGLLERARAAACNLLGTCAVPEGQGQGKGQGRGRRAHLVELAEVEVGTLRITSVYTGSLRNRRAVRVFNQEEGRVTSLPFFEGDRVTTGAVVLELDRTLFAAELDKAVAVRADAETSLDRVNRLERGNLISQDEITRAATAVQIARAEERVLRARLGYTRVSAPFDSVVSARLVEVGDIVPRHTHVLTLSDPSSLVTSLAVSELLIPHITRGDPVTVLIDALGDRPFPGTVLRIHPDLDPRTRQGMVEIELSPVPSGTQSGQFARVTFTTEALERSHVPFAALRRDREGEFVYRLGDAGKVARVAVRSGRRLADRVEILEGLEGGDQIVTKGFLGLSNGKQVEPVDAPAAAVAGRPGRGPGDGPRAPGRGAGAGRS